MTELIFVYFNNDIKIEENHIKKYEVGIVGAIEKDYYIVNVINLDYPIKVSKKELTIFNAKQTGDGFKMKVCNVCNRLLPVEYFSKNQNGKNNRTVRRPSCNDCRVIIDGTDVPSKVKTEWKKKMPNYTMWECPICHKKTIPGLTSKVVLDHNHQTGEPRAWICDSCNTGLGRFKDSIELLQSAIDYLKKVE